MHLSHGLFTLPVFFFGCVSSIDFAFVLHFLTFQPALRRVFSRLFLSIDRGEFLCTFPAYLLGGAKFVFLYSLFVPSVFLFFWSSRLHFPAPFWFVLFVCAFFRAYDLGPTPGGVRNLPGFGFPLCFSFRGPLLSSRLLRNVNRLFGPPVLDILCLRSFGQGVFLRTFSTLV